MNQQTDTMKRTYKLIASRGNEIVFDACIQSATPRDARRELKKLLGLTCLSGIVYSITEIPVDLIREIVDTRILSLCPLARNANPCATGGFSARNCFGRNIVYF